MPTSLPPDYVPGRRRRIQQEEPTTRHPDKGRRILRLAAFAWISASLVLWLENNIGVRRSDPAAPPPESPPAIVHPHAISITNPPQLFKERTPEEEIQRQRKDIEKCIGAYKVKRKLKRNKN